MWETESKFVHYVANKLNKEGAFMMRIETGSTARGVPDMYVQANGDDYWIEFKNCKKEPVEIPWRDGQQSWAHKYCKHTLQRITSDVYKLKYSWTCVGSPSGITLIRMNKIWEDRKPDPSAIYKVDKYDKITDILFAHSYDVMDYSSDAYNELEWYIRLMSPLCVGDIDYYLEDYKEDVNDVKTAYDLDIYRRGMRDIAWSIIRNHIDNVQK